MTSPEIVLREIEQLSEMREVERLQKTIWGVEDLDVLPALAMRPLVAVGGILIGAFVDNRMVGFVLGFPGQINGQNIIHSDMLGVLPEYRSHGLGYRLKLAQRERALARGIETITWTFDPLRAVNARLNFARLGVYAARYEIDYYGDTSSVLHRLGTDRLWVTWDLLSERTRMLMESPETESAQSLRDSDALLLVRVGEKQQPVLTVDLTTNQLMIEIPLNLDQLLKSEPERAVEWRMATRAAFTQALNRGYVVRDFVLEKPASKGTYLLTQS